MPAAVGTTTTTTTTTTTMESYHHFRTMMLSADALKAFLVKVVRLTLSVTTLTYVSSLFTEWFSHARNHGRVKLPSLRTFVCTYFGIELLLNVCITFACMLIGLPETVIVASGLDYIFSALISFKLSWDAGSNLSRLADRYDLYRVQGTDMIRVQTDFIMSYIVLHMFIPYYLVILGLLGKRLRPS